jgi:flagellar protein FliS
MMPSPESDRYLEAEVLTAPPHKRQLMLVDACVRFVEQARRHWRAGQDEAASECLIRAQKIVTELLAALNHEVDPKLTRRVASLYVFVFRALVDASLHRDEAKLDDALRVLQPQREAWEGVCQELGAAAPRENEAAAASLSAHEEKGDRHLLCEAPFGPFRQKVPLTFFHAGPEAPAGSESPNDASAGFSTEA